MTPDNRHSAKPDAQAGETAGGDYRLYHLPLSPGSRFVRLLRGERRLGVELKEERVWEHRRGFLRINPAGEVPVLIAPDGGAVCGLISIADHLVRLHPDAALPLLPEEAGLRAETLRLFDWFDRKFSAEMSEGLLLEKVTRRFLAP